MQSDEVNIETKYLRVGWIDRDSVADGFAKQLFHEFEGEVLPAYWQYRSIEHFQKKFGDKPFHWARAYSFHLMIFRGHRVLRLWTDCATTATLDVSDALEANIRSNSPSLAAKLEAIPEKTLGKSVPMTKRLTLAADEDVAELKRVIKVMYGI